MRRLLYCLFFAALSLGSSTAQARASFDDIYGSDDGYREGGGSSEINILSYIGLALICGLILLCCVSDKKLRTGVIFLAIFSTCILTVFKIYGKESGLVACAVGCIIAAMLDPAISNKFKSLSTGSSKYLFGFVALLTCIALFTLPQIKPKILPSDTSVSSIGASTNLPAVSTLSDSKDSAELVTQAADKPPEAKEQTSNASSKQGGLGLATGEVLVTGSSGGSKSFSPAQEAWLGNADRTDPAILHRMRSAVPDR